MSHLKVQNMKKLLHINLQIKKFNLQIQSQKYKDRYFFILNSLSQQSLALLYKEKNFQNHLQKIFQDSNLFKNTRPYLNFQRCRFEQNLLLNVIFKPIVMPFEILKIVLWISPLIHYRHKPQKILNDLLVLIFLKNHISKFSFYHGLKI